MRGAWKRGARVRVSSAKLILSGTLTKCNTGTILNVTSTTGLEVPPFPGEAVYHASKACQEAFSNVLRTELVGTDIKVLCLRPGVVATNFHEARYVAFNFKPRWPH
jgi:short-subunit dehydrogenase